MEYISNEENENRRKIIKRIIEQLKLEIDRLGKLYNLS